MTGVTIRSNYIATINSLIAILTGLLGYKQALASDTDSVVPYFSAISISAVVSIIFSASVTHKKSFAEYDTKDLPSRYKLLLCLWLLTTVTASIIYISDRQLSSLYLIYATTSSFLSLMTYTHSSRMLLLDNSCYWRIQAAGSAGKSLGIWVLVLWAHTGFTGLLISNCIAPMVILGMYISMGKNHQIGRAIIKSKMTLYPLFSIEGYLMMMKSGYESFIVSLTPVILSHVPSGGNLLHYSVMLAPYASTMIVSTRMALNNKEFQVYNGIGIGKFKLYCTVLLVALICLVFCIPYSDNSNSILNVLLPTGINFRIFIVTMAGCAGATIMTLGYTYIDYMSSKTIAKILLVSIMSLIGMALILFSMHNFIGPYTASIIMCLGPTSIAIAVNTVK